MARYLALSSVCHFRGSPFELSIHMGSVFCPVIKGFESTPLMMMESIWTNGLYLLFLL